MQRKALATAVALGLSVSLITAPSADAAQIGAKDANDTCAVRLTDAEQSALEEAIQSISIPKAGEAVAEAIETVYPEFKAPADAFFSNPVVEAVANAYAADKEPSANVLEEFDSLLETQFAAVSEDSAEAFEIYLYARGYTAYPSLAESEFLSEIKDELPTLTEVAASRDNVTVDVVGLAIDLLGLPANKARAFRNSIENSDFGRTTLTHYQEYAKTYNAAQRACADGGKTDVRFPTKSTTPGAGQNTGSQNPNEETKSNRDPNTGTGTGTKNDKTNATGTGTGTKNDKNQNDNTTGNNDDAGSSETGKIIGIVAGVLAAIGLIAAGVVAFAPQLGIQLPF